MIIIQRKYINYKKKYKAYNNRLERISRPMMKIWNR